MKLSKTVLLVVVVMLSQAVLAQGNAAGAPAFSYDQQRLAKAQPWTSQAFQNDPDEFQFVIIGDRTGGANVRKTFEIALGQINLLQPEFVINVGDLIEGYSDDKAALNAEWEALDKLLGGLRMPFFRTPGNHDIANNAAQEVWRDRYGASYYYFVYPSTRKGLATWITSCG